MPWVEENQSSRRSRGGGECGVGVAEMRTGESLITVMDLSQLCESHFMRLFIKSELHLHNIFPHLWLLGREH